MSKGGKAPPDDDDGVDPLDVVPAPMDVDEEEPEVVEDVPLMVLAICLNVGNPPPSKPPPRPRVME